MSARSRLALLAIPSALAVLVTGCSAASSAAPRSNAPKAPTSTSSPGPATSAAPNSSVKSTARTTINGVRPEPTTPADIARPVDAPVLGAKGDNPFSRGFGQVRPKMINLGGADAGFVVEGIRWDGWGGRKAVGHGTAVVPGPGETLGETRPSRVTVVASRLGTCAGRPAYLAVQWFDPAKGGHFDPKENLDTCPDTSLPFVQEPWAAGLDFGFVTDARIDKRGLVVTFDRAQWLSGKAYRDHVAKHGTPENDYVILNTSTKTRTFRVPPSATMYGNQLLGRQDGLRNEVISPERLVQRVRQNGDRGVPVWLQHDKGANGPVVYLAEQYLP